MMILFCISLIGGAVLFHSGGFSLGEIGGVALLWGVLVCFMVRRWRSYVLGVVLACTVMLGALRMWMIPVHEISLGNQAFTAIVKSVDVRLDKTLLVVKKDTHDEVVQVTLRDASTLLPGDAVSVRGTVALPEDFTTDTGRTFAYDEYLLSRGVDAVISRGQVVKIHEGGFSLTRIATSVRFWIAGVLASYIVFPVDGIVAGMLVGFQGGIPSYLSDIFRFTGTLHTLVLSGYNITVLAGFLGFMLRRVPFRLRTLMIGGGIVILVLISGAGVAAVRAGIMGTLALVASMTLHEYNVLRALVLSVLAFFFVSPLTIVVDPGFQLSFLATLFIITLLPILDKRCSWIPQGRISLREMLILAIGLPLFMLPYMMYFSGLFPFVSPLANIFLVPIIPILMLGGLCVIVCSFVPFVASILGVVTGCIGTITISVLTFFSTLPQWHTPALSSWGVVVFYIVLYAVVFRRELLTYLSHLRIVFARQTS